jgi:Major Facilitator Superfamily
MSPPPESEPTTPVLEPPATPPRPPASVRSLLSDRSVGAVFITLLTSSIGWAALATTLAIHVFSITDSKRDLGLLGLAEFLPAAILVFVSGTIADRFDRRKVIVFGVVLELLAVGALMKLDYSTVRTAAPFLGLTVIMGVGRSAVGPSMRSLVPAAAPPGQLPRVIALSSSTWQLSAIFGPLLGATAYKVSPRFSYGIAASLLAISVVMALAIPEAVGRAHLASPDAEPNEQPTLRAAFQGLSSVWKQPILFGAIALDLFAVLFGGAVALLPAVAKELLGGGSEQVGILRAVGGVGATLVTFALAARPLRNRIGRTLLVAVGVFGVATIVFGISRSIWVSGLAMLVLSGADSVSVFIRSTLVPLVTPAAERGRVLAVEAVFIGASNELGAFESGEVAHHFGTVASIISGGVLTLVVVVVWWLVFPALRNVDRFEDLDGYNAS